MGVGQLVRIAAFYICLLVVAGVVTSAVLQACTP
jgi:hypothetical protein